MRWLLEIILRFEKKRDERMIVNPERERGRGKRRRRDRTRYTTTRDAAFAASTHSSWNYIPTIARTRSIRRTICTRTHERSSYPKNWTFAISTLTIIFVFSKYLKNSLVTNWPSDNCVEQNGIKLWIIYFVLDLWLITGSRHTEKKPSVGTAKLVHYINLLTAQLRSPQHNLLLLFQPVRRTQHLSCQILYREFSYLYYFFPCEFDLKSSAWQY